MFDDILGLVDDNEEITLENSMELASFLEMDESIVTENFKEFTESVKKRLGSFAHTVALFIQKMTNRIKQFFLEMGKADRYYVNQGLYKYIMQVYNKLGKIKPGIKVALAVKKVNKAYGEKGEGVKKDPGTEAMEKAANEMKEELDKLEANEFASIQKVLDNEEYAKLGLAEGKTLTFEYSTLAKMQGDITATLKDLDTNQKHLQEVSNKLTETDAVDAKAITAAINVITQQIKKANLQSKSLSALRRGSRREDEKAKNTRKYWNEPEPKKEKK